MPEFDRNQNLDHNIFDLDFKWISELSNGFHKLSTALFAARFPIDPNPAGTNRCKPC